MRKRHTAEQIAQALCQAEAGTPVKDVTVVGAMTIDRLRHTITVAGDTVHVKPQEFSLIEHSRAD